MQNRGRYKWSQVFLGFIFSLIALILLAIGITRIWVWFNANFAGRSYNYQVTRGDAARGAFFEETQKATQRPIALTKDLLFKNKPDVKFPVQPHPVTMTPIDTAQCCRECAVGYPPLGPNHNQACSCHDASKVVTLTLQAEKYSTSQSVWVESNYTSTAMKFYKDDQVAPTANTYLDKNNNFIDTTAKGDRNYYKAKLEPSDSADKFQPDLDPLDVAGCGPIPATPVPTSYTPSDKSLSVYGSQGAYLIDNAISRDHICRADLLCDCRVGAFDNIEATKSGAESLRADAQTLWVQAQKLRDKASDCDDFWEICWWFGFGKTSRELKEAAGELEGMAQNQCLAAERFDGGFYDSTALCQAASDKGDTHANVPCSVCPTLVALYNCNQKQTGGADNPLYRAGCQPHDPFGFRAAFKTPFGDPTHTAADNSVYAGYIGELLACCDTIKTIDLTQYDAKALSDSCMADVMERMGSTCRDASEDLITKYQTRVKAIDNAYGGLYNEIQYANLVDSTCQLQKWRFCRHSCWAGGVPPTGLPNFQGPPPSDPSGVYTPPLTDLPYFQDHQVTVNYTTVAYDAHNQPYNVVTPVTLNVPGAKLVASFRNNLPNYSTCINSQTTFCPENPWEVHTELGMAYVFYNDTVAPEVEYGAVDPAQYDATIAQAIPGDTGIPGKIVANYPAPWLLTALNYPAPDPNILPPAWLSWKWNTGFGSLGNDSVSGQMDLSCYNTCMAQENQCSTCYSSKMPELDPSAYYNYTYEYDFYAGTQRSVYNINTAPNTASSPNVIRECGGITYPGNNPNISNSVPGDVNDPNASWGRGAYTPHTASITNPDGSTGIGWVGPLTYDTNNQNYDNTVPPNVNLPRGLYNCSMDPATPEDTIDHVGTPDNPTNPNYHKEDPACGKKSFTQYTQEQISKLGREESRIKDSYSWIPKCCDMDVDYCTQCVPDGTKKQQDDYAACMMSRPAKELMCLHKIDLSVKNDDANMTIQNPLTNSGACTSSSLY